LNLSCGLRLARLAMIPRQGSLRHMASSSSSVCKSVRAGTRVSGPRSSSALQENTKLFFQSAQSLGLSVSLGHQVSPCLCTVSASLRNANLGNKRRGGIGVHRYNQIGAGAAIYVKEIQTTAKSSRLSKIASSIGVTLMYALGIRRGRPRPHPRHWPSLARSAGISVNG
jgi:hypothetical protein